MLNMVCVSLFSPGLEAYLYDGPDAQCVQFWDTKLKPDTYVLCPPTAVSLD